MSLRKLECVLAGAVLTAASLASGCDDGAPSPDEGTGTRAEALSGEALFETATFGGNGRSCATCHNEGNAFTMSPELAQDFFEDDPEGPLFRSIDSDDGVGDSYSRLLAHATIRVVMPLPPTVRLHDDPTATTAVVNRGIPTINNVDLEPVLMSDGREPTLESQAVGAVNAHFEPGQQPSAQQVGKIVHYETKQFSSTALKEFANGEGPDPGLPPGNTESEIRGRAFLEPGGRCGICHSGPLLNATSELHPFLPPGLRFEFIFAGFPEMFGGEPPADPAGPIRTWDFKCPDGPSFVCDEAGFEVVDGWVSIPARDPGLSLVTGNADDTFAFKISGLRDVVHTAPYFHDNSAASLEDVLRHYDFYFTIFEGVGLSSEEQADIINYMKLL